MEHMRRVDQREWARRWRDGAIGSVEFLSARYYTQVFAPHTHEGYAFGVIEDGAEAFHYRGALHVAPPGSVVVLDPDEIHTGHTAAGAPGWQYRMLYPSVELVSKASNWPDRGTITFPNPVIADPELAAAIRAMHRNAEAHAPSLGAEAELISLLTAATERHAVGARRRRIPIDHRGARLTREYIDAHYARNISLTELSAVADLSPFHLNRVFRSVIGLPPHRYLEQVRVRKARELLVGGLPLSQVALESGFTDQSHFTRHFKRHLGVTPGQYRRAVSGAG
jgi:AraC-like DNA-binding protein